MTEDLSPEGIKKFASGRCFIIDLERRLDSRGNGRRISGAVMVYLRNRRRYIIKGLRRMNYTYLLECADHTLYCGWTNDLTKRLKAHNSGKGAKYTKSRRPVILAYYEEFETREEAMKREAAIKRMRRSEKVELIKKKTNGKGGTGAADLG